MKVYPNGHTAAVSGFPDEQVGGIMEDYKASLMGKYGGNEKKVRGVLHQKVHSTTLFPTFDLLSVQNSLRVIIPKAVDYTEIRIYPIRMKGAPEELFAEHVRLVGLTHSATSFVQGDDLESFRRVQEGVATQGADWLLIARGLKREKWDNRGIGTGTRSTEIGNRHQYRAWLDLMCAA